MILGRLCLIVVDVACEEKLEITWVQFVCAPYARSLKVQELLFKDNDYRVFQTEVSETITSDSVKYSRLFRSQH